MWQLMAGPCLHFWLHYMFDEINPLYYVSYFNLYDHSEENHSIHSQ